MRISVFITIVIYTFFDHKLLYSSTYKEYLMSYMSLHHALYVHWVFCTICDCLAVHAQRVVLKVR